jgi:hypothetical protein
MGKVEEGRGENVRGGKQKREEGNWNRGSVHSLF